MVSAARRGLPHGRRLRSDSRMLLLVPPMRGRCHGQRIRNHGMKFRGELPARGDVQKAHDSEASICRCRSSRRPKEKARGGLFQPKAKARDGLPCHHGRDSTLGEPQGGTAAAGIGFLAGRGEEDGQHPRDDPEDHRDRRQDHKVDASEGLRAGQSQEGGGGAAHVLDEPAASMGTLLRRAGNPAPGFGSIRRKGTELPGEVQRGAWHPHRRQEGGPRRVQAGGRRPDKGGSRRSGRGHRAARGHHCASAPATGTHCLPTAQRGPQPALRPRGFYPMSWLHSVTGEWGFLCEQMAALQSTKLAFEVGLFDQPTFQQEIGGKLRKMETSSLTKQVRFACFTKPSRSEKSCDLVPR